MTSADQFMSALCLWREARGEGTNGMTAIMCVLRNRVARHNSSYYAEVIKKWQFSSITAIGDPQLGLYPQSTDPQWQLATNLVGMIGPEDSRVADVTGGATLYYDDSIAFPASWNRAVVQSTVKIGRLNFFKEL